jgi:hypothetical protein
MVTVAEFILTDGVTTVIVTIVFTGIPAMLALYFKTRNQVSDGVDVRARIVGGPEMN